MKTIPPLEGLRTFEEQLALDHHQQVEMNRIHGEHDGRRNLPAVADEIIPPQEWQVLTHYQAKVEEAGRLIRQMLHEVKDNQWQPAVNALLQWSETYKQQMIDNALRVRDRKLEEASENHFDRLKVLENTPSYSKAKSDIEAAENRLSSVANRLGRYILERKISSTRAVLIAVLIGILEVPLNNQIFMLFGDHDTTMTLLLSLSLVFLMPLVAHFGGRFLRQGSERPAYYFIGIAFTAGAIILSYFAAKLRTTALHGQAPTFITEPFFFTLNVLFYTAAAMASYLAHDPSVSLSEAHKALRREKRQHRRILTHFEKLIKAETDRFQSEKEAIQREFTQAELAAQNSLDAIHQAGHAATALYNRLLSWGKGLERELQTHSHSTILARREENMKFRTNHAQPKSWSKPLPTLSLTLQEMTEISWPA